MGRKLRYTEAMPVYDDMFKIKSFNDIIPIIESQQYLAKGTECETCELYFSCYNRKIILLRDYLGEDRCIAPKEYMIRNGIKKYVRYAKIIKY